LELERELQRVTDELEREGRLHNHRERQRLAKVIEEERLAHAEDRRDARREAERLEREVQRLGELVESWEELSEKTRGAPRSAIRACGRPSLATAAVSAFSLAVERETGGSSPERL
jgi:hypothetical protein